MHVAGGSPPPTAHVAAPTAESVRRARVYMHVAGGTQGGASTSVLCAGAGSGGAPAAHPSFPFPFLPLPFPFPLPGHNITIHHFARQGIPRGVLLDRAEPTCTRAL